MHANRIVELTTADTLTVTLGLVGSDGAQGQPAGTPETKAAVVIRPAIAGHCVDAGFHADDISQASGADTGTVQEEIDQAGISVLGAGQTGENIKPIPAGVLDVRPLDEGDVALLKVEADNLPSAELGDGSDPAVGTPVLAAGFPQSTDEYSTAIEKFDSTLGLSPSYPNAFEMRTDSVRQREQFGDNISRGLQPWMFVVIVGLAAAGLIYYPHTHGTGGSDAELPGGTLPAGSAPPPTPPMGGGAPTQPAPAPVSPAATTATTPQDTGFALGPGQTFGGRCGKSQH